MKKLNEMDSDMIVSIEMWLHEIEPKWVEKELAWLEELRTRLAEEPVSDCHGLEEEVKRYYSDNFEYITSDQPTLSILTNIARHFAEWQKAKMMEGAVEGVVCYGSKGAYIETDFLGEYDTDVYGNPGDKVKIIVVKED